MTTRTPFRILVCTAVLLPLLLSASSSPAQEADDATPMREPKVKTLLGSQTLAQAAVQELSDEQVDLIQEQLVNALADLYFAKAPNDTLKEFLTANPDIRKHFILAIDPQHDDVSRVFEIFNDLVTKYPKQAKRYHHLFIAFAVVFDNPKMPVRPTVLGSPVPPAPSMDDSVEYYLKGMKLMLYSADNMRWPFLIHVVDCDLPIIERKWALSQFKSRRKNLAGTYRSVPYDWDKITGVPDMQDHPYVLPNLKKLGGICVDQAYFASRVCKAFGVPSQGFVGTGNTGIGHAWVGFFTIRKSSPYLDFYGRYREDLYYVGTYTNPQTGRRETDRQMECAFAAAGRSYENMVKAQALMRVAQLLYNDDHETAIALAEKATQVNPYVASAWQLLAQAVADGKIEPGQRQRLFDELMKSCAGLPDLVFEVFVKFLGPWEEKTWKNRMKIYDRAFALFKGRPDLQIQLREQQGDELVAAGNSKFALVVYGKTAQALPKEGTRMLGLARKAEDIFRDQGRLGHAVTFYESVIRFVPRKRSRFLSPAYVELATSLANLCEEIGDEKRARKWRRSATLRGGDDDDD